MFNQRNGTSSGTTGTGGLSMPGSSGSQPGTGDSAGDASASAKTTGKGGSGQGQGQGQAQTQGRGFDWNEAAKDAPPAGDDGSGSNPSAGSELTGMAGGIEAAQPLQEMSPPARPSIDRACLRSGKRICKAGRSNRASTRKPTSSRAKSLSGLSSLVSPGIAEKLAGAVSEYTSTGAPSSASSSNSTSNNQSGGMPRSLSSSNSTSNNQPGGMPLGSNTQTSMFSPSTSGDFGQNTSSSSPSDEADSLIMPPRPKQAPPIGSIEVRFEIVVVCRKDDIVLQPGSYRITSDILRSTAQGSDGTLAREIRAMVRNRALVDPLIRQKPAIRFLVESQGGDTFAIARRQLLFALPEWPVSLQVAGSQDVNVFNRNRW